MIGKDENMNKDLSPTQEVIRNVAIIAHVDHGKITLFDQLFRHSGMFRENQVVSERLMDSLDLEQERGRIFIKPAMEVYAGQIIGEHCRAADLVGNPAKGKQLTNIRAAGTDDAAVLTPPVEMSLEERIAYNNDGELVEITPKAIRLRKVKARVKP
jgi:predicted membrane GTPase involved in stress response